MADGLLSFLQTPEGQGLLSAGFAGLAGARRGAPLNTIGAAGLAGLSGYSGAQDRQAQQQSQEQMRTLQGLQMEKLRRGLDAPDVQTYRPGDVVYKDGQVACTVPKEAETPSSVREYEYAKQGGYAGSYDEFRKQSASTAPYYSPVPTEAGYMSFNSRTGQWSPMAGAGGRPMMPASQSPELQGRLAGAKTSATEAAKKEVEAQFDAPAAIAKGQEALTLVDDLLKSPGFGTAVGTSRMFGLHKIPGTDARNFDIRLDQIKGQQFLQAFETLKGGGQITEVEGRKATDAISRMNPEASEKEFKKAADDFKKVIQKGLERAQARAGIQPTQPSQSSVVQPGQVRAKAVRWDSLKGE